MKDFTFGNVIMLYRGHTPERKFIMSRKKQETKPLIVAGIDVSNRTNIWFTREELDKLTDCGYFMCRIPEPTSLNDLEYPVWRNFNVLVFGGSRKEFYFFQPGNKLRLERIPDDEVEAAVRARYEALGVKCHDRHIHWYNSYRVILVREGHEDEDVSDFFELHYGAMNRLKEYELPPCMARDEWGRIFKLRVKNGHISNILGPSLHYDHRALDEWNLIYTDVTPEWMGTDRYRKAVCDFDMSLAYFTPTEHDWGDKKGPITPFNMDEFTFFHFFENPDDAMELYQIAPYRLKNAAKNWLKGRYGEIPDWLKESGWLERFGGKNISATEFTDTADAGTGHTNESGAAEALSQSVASMDTASDAAYGANGYVEYDYEDLEDFKDND